MGERLGRVVRYVVPKTKLGSAFAGGVLVGTVALGGLTAYGSIPDSSGVIHGCYSTANRALSVINYPKVSTCPTGTKSLNWSQGVSSGSIYGAQVWVGDFQPTGPSDGTHLASCPAGQVVVAASAWLVANTVSGGAPQPLVAQIAYSNQFENRAEIYAGQYASDFSDPSARISWNLTCGNIGG